jgi:hypothetical protein
MRSIILFLKKKYLITFLRVSIFVVIQLNKIAEQSRVHDYKRFKEPGLTRVNSMLLS